MMYMSNKIIVGAVLSALAVSASAEVDAKANASCAATPLKVLMIGNSFTESVMRETPNLAKSEGLPLDIVQCGIGGCPLEKHWANVEKAGDKEFKPYGISARFSSDPDRRFPKKSNVTDMLVAEKWHIVTIQQASGKSAFYDTYQPYADNLIAKIRELAPQAEIVIQETWSYSPYAKRLADWKMTPKEMYESLEVSESLKGLKERIGLLIPVYEESLAKVKALENQDAQDFLARRLYDMTAELVMSLLILRDATKAPELFEKSANVYVRMTEEDVIGKMSYIKLFNVDALENFKAAAEEKPAS